MNVPALRHLARTLPKYLFMFSLCLFSLFYGVLAGHYEFFPEPQLRDAKSGAEALVEIFGKEEQSEVVRDEPDDALPSRSVVENYAGIDDGALILVSGGSGYLESYNPDGGCLAWLMNREGEIQHIWKYSPDLWADLQHVSTVPGKSRIYPFGVQMLPDGGLLASFQGLNTWPFAIGMVRLDKDSNIVWKKECFAHHYFIITPDQKIITPTVRVLEGAQPIGLTRGRIKSGKVLEDFITVMTLDGEILEEISMLDVVHDSGLVGLYQGAYGRSIDVDTDDPLHLNFVRLVGEKVAAANDWLNADDLLVSFRSINMIAIIDRPTLRIKWRTIGTTLRQHSPLFLGTDSLLVLDNHGGNESLGGTRLAKIGLKSRNAVTIFPTEINRPDRDVHSESGGFLDFNREKNAVLMALTRQDTLLEIDPETGELLWEYRYSNTHSTGRPLFTAKYCYDVSFDMNQTKGVE